MRKTLFAATAALIAFSGAAYAQTMVITKDPVMTNSTVVMPGEVRTYVMQQNVPSVVYDGQIAVGTALPETVVVQPVDGYSDYGYTVVNKQRVIVNPQTRTVIQVLQ